MIKKCTKPALFLSLSLLLNTTGVLNADELTTVYKAVSEDGSISFSDEAQNGAEAIKVKPITTIPAIDIKQNKSLNPTENTPTDPYQNLRIISPANDSAFNTGNGDVQVVVESVPSLRRSDSYVLELDGKIVATQRATTFNLQSVDRGTHTLSVKIVDRSKQTLKVAISTITIHRPVKRRPQPRAFN